MPFGNAGVARTDACGQPCDKPMLDFTVQPRASQPCRWHSPSWSAVPPEARQTGRATTAALPAGKPQRRRGAAAWLWPCLRYRSHEGSLVSLLHGFELLVGPWGALSAVAEHKSCCRLPAAPGCIETFRGHDQLCSERTKRLHGAWPTGPAAQQHKCPSLHRRLHAFCCPPCPEQPATISFQPTGARVQRAE